MGTTPYHPVFGSFRDSKPRWETRRKKNTQAPQNKQHQQNPPATSIPIPMFRFHRSTTGLGRARFSEARLTSHTPTTRVVPSIASRFSAEARALRARSASEREEVHVSAFQPCGKAWQAAIACRCFEVQARGRRSDRVRSRRVVGEARGGG